CNTEGVDSLFKIFVHAEETADPVAYVQQHAPHLPIDTIQCLSRKYEGESVEEQEDWDARFYQFFMENPAGRQLSNDAANVGRPKSNADSDSSHDAGRSTSIDAIDPEDDGKWLTAHRQDMTFE